MRTNCFLSWASKKSDLDEVVFQVGEWPSEVIICLLVVLKCVFGEVDEASFLGVERACKVIFFLMGIQKSDLDEVAVVMFQVGEWP
jgi:hypothetical protein